MKYSLQLIWGYINGEEINNIDKLEDDWEFLFEVIKVSNDKKMYNLCSKKIKTNYQFVKKMVELFKADKEFVRLIANEYLNSNNINDTDSIELNFIMCDILENTANVEEKLEYNLTRLSVYLNEMISTSIIIEEEENVNVKSLYGLGFILLENGTYSQSEIIIKYFARKLLDKIFGENDSNIEKIIHTKFKKIEDLEQYGINTFIINYVSSYDIYLAEYITNHLEIINSIKDNILKIKNNWTNYEQNANSNMMSIFEEKVNEILEKHDYCLSYDEVCYYIDKMKLGIPIKLFDDEDNDDSNYLPISYFNEKCDKCLLEIANLASSLFVNKNSANRRNGKAKILKFRNNDSN